MNGVLQMKIFKAQPPLKTLFRLSRRSFFRSMGYTDFSESEVLTRIYDGVYIYDVLHTDDKHSHQSLKRKVLEFEKNKKLLIYDSSDHYL